MTTRQSPTARHRRLMAELNQLRKDSGKTREQVADLIGLTDTSLWRWETGLTRPKPSDVSMLLEVYGITGTARTELLEMAKDARKRGWWHRHRQALKPGFDSYIGLEAAAAVIRVYESQVVPGLLQTGPYARAVIEATAIGAFPIEVDEKVTVRISRQDLITRSTDPMRLVAVLDEAVLRRDVGGRDVMREQLARLAEMAQEPNVEIRVIPFTAGAHAGMDGKFNLLEFSDPNDPDLVYLEQATSGLVPEDVEEVRRYTVIFGNLLAKALSPNESIAFIASIAHNERYSGRPSVGRPYVPA